MGKDRFEVARLHAGDLGVVAKLKSAHTNDTLCDMSRPVILEKIAFPKPEIAVAILGEGRGDGDKLGEVLPKLHEEDPTFVTEFDPELHQTIARGLGELHLAVQMERMKRKYGVAVRMEQPRIAYRETITMEAEGQGRPQETIGGPRPVRGLLDPAQTTSGGEGVRIRQFHQGRGDPNEVRPLRGQGDPGGGCSGSPRRFSVRRLRGAVLRWLLPLGGLRATSPSSWPVPARSKNVLGKVSARNPGAYHRDHGDHTRRFRWRHHE